MLKLFAEAAKDRSIEEKLDEIINLNKVLIGRLDSLNANDLAEKQKIKEQSLNFPKPSFQPAPQPRFQQPPGFQKSFNERQQEFDELPELKELEQPPRPYQQGPVAMPSVPFASFSEPKRKGLFGRLRR